MARRAVVYGLDIETDTTAPDPLDPAVAAVRTVAISSPGFDEVFSGDERGLLADLDRRMAELAAGVIATWNGAAFDLPFLTVRAALHAVPFGLRIRADRVPGTYRAAWYGHDHVDAYRIYRGDGDLGREAQHALATNDARLARVLTERRWSTACRFLDRLDRSAFALDAS